MPLEVDLSQDDHVSLRATGALSLADLLAALQVMGKDPQSRALGRHLLDLREMKSLELDASHLRKILAEKPAIKGLLKGGRIAVVAPSDPSAQIQPIYQQLIARLPFEYKIFAEREIARAWLASGSSGQ